MVCINGNNIIRPYSFKNITGTAVTINVERYREMSQNFLIPALNNRLEIRFQQGGATAPTAGATMTSLKQVWQSFNSKAIRD